LAAGAGAFEAGLDQGLAAADYGGLTQRIEGALAGTDDGLRLRVVNWLALKQSHGDTDSIFIGQLYAVGLLAMAAHAPEPARSAWIKDSVTAYDRVILTFMSEGGQCADGVAVDTRLGLVAHNMQPVQQMMLRLPQAQRDAAARDAFVLSALTFRHRYPDGWLCRGRDGRASFVPFDRWGPRVASARDQFARNFVHGGAPLVTLPALLQKDPAVLAAYGN